MKDAKNVNACATMRIPAAPGSHQQAVNGQIQEETRSNDDEGKFLYNRADIAQLAHRNCLTIQIR